MKGDVVRFPFRIMTLVTALALVGCGAATAPGTPFDLSPQLPGLDAVRPAEVDATDLTSHGQFIRPAAPIEGRVLDDVLPRLYFVATSRQPALPDVAKLRAIGTEAVDLEGARIVDDMNSPFGQGAAAHFELLMPAERRIEPGQEVEIEVRFLADTMELQNAVLEIHTNADNTPVLRVSLTGKFFQTR